MSAPTNYTLVAGPTYHIQRKKQIAKKYPAVKQLMGHNPVSALWIVGITTIQYLIAWALNDSTWWVILLAAYFFGAFANHAMYVLIHECTHNLVFKKSVHNKWMGLVCDFPLMIPGSLGFRKYHMLHHRHLGEYDMDPDITSHFEAKLVGNNPLTKILWLTLFSISQALRPLKLRNVRLMNGWIVTNLFLQVAINIAVYMLMGPGAFIYLLTSTLFGLGLHPVGGRWIQEHYVTKNGQETYSYYGPLNKVCFNMGYHNEHHDFMNVPWNNLPKLKKLAPEFYNNLASYRSWSWVLWNFFFNSKMSIYSRIIHPSANSPAEKKQKQQDLELNEAY